MRLAVALSVLAMPALAMEPSACVSLVENPPPGVRPGPPDVQGRSPWYRREQALPVDLGDGWVAEPYVVASETGTQIGTVVTDCASGTNLTVVERALSADGRINFDARVRAIPVLKAAIAAPETITLRGVIARLEAGGANVGRDLRARNHETCGCAAFYPERRGGKAGWSG